jgi:16S rRNA C967 or C1407 C5-methylase (RsmB/RsmF family)
MRSTFICLHCGGKFQCNPRIKKQKYCSSPICQNARKRLHDKKTIATSRGKSLKQARNKRWLEKYPDDVYMDKYRKEHPKYEEENRKKQKIRNQKNRPDQQSMIVKTDALLLQPRGDGAYMAFKVKKQKIVKTDTLLLQMQVQTAIEAHFPQKLG